MLFKLFVLSRDQPLWQPWFYYLASGPVIFVCERSHLIIPGKLWLRILVLRCRHSQFLKNSACNLSKKIQKNIYKTKSIKVSVFTLEIFNMLHLEKVHKILQYQSSNDSPSIHFTYSPCSGMPGKLPQIPAIPTFFQKQAVTLFFPNNKLN